MADGCVTDSVRRGILIAALLCFLKTPNPFKYAIKILKCVMNIKKWRSPPSMNTLLLLSYKRSCNVTYFTGADGDCTLQLKDACPLEEKL